MKLISEMSDYREWEERNEKKKMRLSGKIDIPVWLLSLEEYKISFK